MIIMIASLTSFVTIDSGHQLFLLFALVPVTVLVLASLLVMISVCLYQKKYSATAANVSIYCT